MTETPVQTGPDHAGAQLEIRHDPGGGRILVLPNRSLSVTGLWLASGACLLALLPAVLISILFAAWPVLPFLGLEAVIILAAFAWLRRHQGDYEEIALDSEHVIHRRVSGSRQERTEFQRYWVRLVEEPGGQPFRPARLWLRSHGQRVELGRDSGAPARAALAQTLTSEFGIVKAAGDPS